MNFPKFSESKEILKIGRSEVCVLGGGAKGQTKKLSLSVCIMFNISKGCLEYCPRDHQQLSCPSFGVNQNFDKVY